MTRNGRVLKALCSFSSWLNLKQGFSSSCFENPLFRPHLPTASKVLCAHYPVCCVSVKTVYVPIVPLTSFGFTWPSRLPSLPAEAGRVSKRNLGFEQPQKIHIFFCKTRQNSKEGKEKEILVNELGNSQAGGKYFQQTVPRFKFRIKLSFKLHDLDIQTPAPDNPLSKWCFCLNGGTFSRCDGAGCSTTPTTFIAQNWTALPTIWLLCSTLNSATLSLMFLLHLATCFCNSHSYSTL